MAAFMGLFFSSAVELAGAGRHKKKKAKWIGRATADHFLFFSKHEIAKIQIVATQKWAWITQNST